MPSLIGSDIAKNYRQQNVPFSRFQTRKIAWYKIGSADVESAPGVLDMEAFNTVIDTIQTRAEIVTIGAPYVLNDSGWNKFMVAVFEDTFNNGNNDLDTEAGYNDMASTLESALNAALDDGSIYVERFYLYGAPGGGDTGPDRGFTSDNDYAEPDLKRDFNDGPYGA